MQGLASGLHLARGLLSSPESALLGRWFGEPGDVQYVVGISPNNGGVTQSHRTCAIPEERLLCWGQLGAVPAGPRARHPEE